MSFLDDFVHISNGPTNGPPVYPGHSVAREFYENSKGQRPFTEGLIVDAIRRRHPKHHLTVCLGFTCDFLAFASAGDDASYTVHGDPNELLVEKQFLLPARRYGDENGGRIVDRVVYGSYNYFYKGYSFLLYVIEGQDGMYKNQYSYLLEGPRADDQEVGSKKSEELIAAAVSALFLYSIFPCMPAGHYVLPELFLCQHLPEGPLLMLFSQNGSKSSTVRSLYLTKDSGKRVRSCMKTSERLNGTMLSWRERKRNPSLMM
jgi:hypothetical protein